MSLIQRERTSLQDDRERLSRAPDQCRDIERSILEHQNAIDSYILFEEQTKAWMAKKKTELTHIKGRIVDFEERTRRMKIEIDDATKSCGLKGINPESAAASRMDNKAKDLQIEKLGRSPIMQGGQLLLLSKGAFSLIFHFMLVPYDLFKLIEF